MRRRMRSEPGAISRLRGRSNRKKPGFYGRAATPSAKRARAALLSELGNLVVEARHLAARRVAVNHALLCGAHDQRLGLLQRIERLAAVAGRDRLLDLAHRSAQLGAARLVDLGAARDLARGFFSGG